MLEGWYKVGKFTASWCRTNCWSIWARLTIGFATVFAIWYPQTVSKLKSRFKTYYDRCIEKATEKMLLFGGLKFEPTSMTRISPNKGCVNHPLGAHESPSIVQWGCPTITHLGNWWPWYGAGYPSLGQTCVVACTPLGFPIKWPLRRYWATLWLHLATSAVGTWMRGASAGIASRSKEWPALSRHEFSGVMKVGLLGSTCWVSTLATWPKKTWPYGSPFNVVNPVPNKKPSQFCQK